MASLMDYGYLLERLSDTPDLKLKITETRNQFGSEMLTEVSELMGIGLSVAVITELFDVQPSTIGKIINVPKRRPDWRCLLRDNRTLLVEAKGSIYKTKSKLQLNEAVEQKNAMQGDLKVATASLLNETHSSEMKIVDPPIFNDELPNNMKKHIFRAIHYASVFSFLGEDILSLYFEKMAKRLSGEIGNEEMADKELMFEELQYQSPSIVLNNKAYAGHLYGPTDNLFLFLGVNKDLLSYRGFTSFRDADEECLIEKGGNQYLIQSDGIIVVKVIDPDSFLSEHQIDSVGIGYDNIVLKDIDSIRDSSFKRYIKYLLEKRYGGVDVIDDGGLRVTINGELRTFYCYHLRNTKGKHPQPRTIRKMAEMMDGKYGVLVTNANIQREEMGFPCIVRADFEIIAEARADVDFLGEVFGR